MKLQSVYTIHEQHSEFFHSKCAKWGRSVLKRESLLKSMGTAQNRKIYSRHGAGENIYGVSFANLAKLRKQIKTNHELALELPDHGCPGFGDP